MSSLEFQMREIGRKISSSESAIRRVEGLLCAGLIFFAILAIYPPEVNSQTRSRSSGWQWQNPFPQGNDLLGIHFSDSGDTGYAVGADGAVIRTRDGGGVWERMISGTDNTLSAVYVRDEKSAVAVGARGTVIVTIDRGLTWRPAQVETGDHLNSVRFSKDHKNTGVLVGTYGSVFLTYDGGASWLPAPVPSRNHMIKGDIGDDGNLVVISKEDWAAIEETIYLNSIHGYIDSLKEVMASPRSEWVNAQELGL